MAARSEKPEFKPPSDGYVIDNLIVDIAKEITSEDVKTLKKRFKVIGHDVEDSTDMLNCLRDQGFIGTYNIMYLQQIARVLERPKLIEILEKYIAMFEDDEVLHFVKKTTETSIGYEIVEFHIIGHLNTNNLEEKRREIARLLLCPLHEIIIKGIQETRSILLTLMIPTMYVDFLLKQLQKYNQRIIKSFLQLNVDKVIVKKDEFLLQKQDGIYQVKKSVIDPSVAKRVKTVSKATKADEDNYYSPKHESPTKRKRASPEIELRTKQSRSENIFERKRLVSGLGYGIRTRGHGTRSRIQILWY